MSDAVARAALPSDLTMDIINRSAVILRPKRPYLEWTTQDHPAYSEERRLYFDAPDGSENQLVNMIPLQDVTAEGEVFTRFRIGFNNSGPAKVIIQAVMTAVESRHNVNNSVWVIG